MWIRSRLFILVYPHYALVMLGLLMLKVSDWRPGWVGDDFLEY